jgi:hypothetical protein
MVKALDMAKNGKAFTLAGDVERAPAMRQG